MKTKGRHSEAGDGRVVRQQRHGLDPFGMRQQSGQISPLSGVIGRHADTQNGIFRVTALRHCNSRRLL
ncbi:MULTISPECIES: hypothetical protein [Rhizobium]|uniref:hypothetical protein n=1 Tax=Rhizobium TaxID=379 RepID=UPI0013EE4852|nr:MULTISPECIES: hypothetical protein [Rhizobium]